MLIDDFLFFIVRSLRLIFILTHVWILLSNSILQFQVSNYWFQVRKKLLDNNYFNFWYGLSLWVEGIKVQNVLLQFISFFSCKKNLCSGTRIFRHPPWLPVPLGKKNKRKKKDGVMKLVNYSNSIMLFSFLPRTTLQPSPNSGPLNWMRIYGSHNNVLLRN